MKNSTAATILGHRLAAQRKSKGWTQEALADEAEVGVATIKRIEQAKVSPSIDILITICRALGIHLHELVHDETITTVDVTKAV